MIHDSTWVTHDEYADFVWKMDNDHRNLTGDSLFRTPQEKQMAKHMLLFNLDLVKPLIASLYSERGKPAKAQITLRSLFLYAACCGKIAPMSLDEWPIEVKLRKELYVLIGCSSKDDVPELQTHYDLLDRLWAGNKTRYSQAAEFDARINCRKSRMQIGEDNKILDPDFKVEEQDRLYNEGIPLGRNDERYIQQFFAFMAVYPSMECGCIPKVICASCDSSALSEHGSQFGKCKCGGNRLNCSWRGICGTPARFSACDGSVGFDSGEDNVYYGQHVVILTCTNRAIHVDLPLSFTFVDANRHDSITIYVTLQEFHRNMPKVFLDYLLGDKAYGNATLAQTMLGEGTIPLFDQASNRTGLSGLPEGMKLDGQFVPCCNDGCQMTLIKNDDEKQCWVYGCPLKSGERKTCPLAENCAVKDAEVVIDPKADPNLFSVIPKEGALYREIYKGRTGIERVNDRLFNDYHLADMKTRNVCHRSFFAAMGCILIHQDAWDKVGILPKGKKASAYYKQLDEEFREILGNKAPKRLERPEPGRKVDTKAVMEMILERNRQESLLEALRSFEVNSFYDLLDAELKGQPEWKCPRKEWEDREKGVNPLLNAPEPLKLTACLTIDWYEAYFVKKWEKVFVPYLPPTVRLDLEGLVEYSPPSPWVRQNIIKHNLKWNETYDPKAEKAPPVVDGFTLVEEGVWKRNAPIIIKVTEQPSEFTEERKGMPGFKEFDGIPETWHTLSYTPPVIPGVNYEKKAEGNDTPTAPTEEPHKPKLERDNRYRCQPLPPRYARAKLKAYERPYRSLSQRG